MMASLSTLIFLLCSSGVFSALPQDSNNFIDMVLRDRLPGEVRNRNLDPAQIPNFDVKVKKTFVTNRDLKVDFTSGLVRGLSQLRRRGDCGAPAWEAANTTFGCHVSLDGVRVSYKAKAKGHKVLGSTNYDVDMFVENTNFFVQITSARSVPAVLKTLSLNSLELKISESTKLGLNNQRRKKYLDAIRSRIQDLLSALLYGSFREALNQAVRTGVAPFP